MASVVPSIPGPALAPPSASGSAGFGDQLGLAAWIGIAVSALVVLAVVVFFMFRYCSTDSGADPDAAAKSRGSDNFRMGRQRRAQDFVDELPARKGYEFIRGEIPGLPKNTVFVQSPGGALDTFRTTGCIEKSDSDSDVSDKRRKKRSKSSRRKSRDTQSSDDNTGDSSASSSSASECSTSLTKIRGAFTAAEQDDIRRMLMIEGKHFAEDKSAGDEGAAGVGYFKSGDIVQIV